MADLDWFPFEPGRWLKNTLHLTARQHGAYLLLTCAAFENRGMLPGTDAGLMAVAKLDAKAWKEDGPVLKAFLTREGDAWVHEFARHLRADAEARVAGKSKAGKAGADKRWNGRRRSDAIGGGNGGAMPEPSGSQWQNDAQIQEQVQIPLEAAASEGAARDVGAPDLTPPTHLDRSVEGRALAAWNDAAKRHGWPEAMFLNSTRRAWLQSRLAECGGLNGWYAALNAAEAAEFIKGQRWFDLDWMLKPENFTRLMEGRYAERHDAKPGSGALSALAEFGRTGTG